MANEVIPNVGRDEDGWPSEEVALRKQQVALRAGVTPRQYEVLLLVVEGLTDKEIGKRLWISEETASSHLKRLKQALRAKTRAHLVAEAFRRDMVY